jgi:type IV pilus assembly protein PilC
MARADLSSLIQWCRALKHGLGIGLSPVKIFRQQAKAGPYALRRVADDLADHLEKGESLADALAESGSAMPPLVHEVVGMAERAGRLPDAFAELEKHYEAVKTSRQQFHRALIWPAMSYSIAILTIATLVFVLGMLGTKDPFGVGLGGGLGAVVVLLLGFGFAGAVVLAYRTAMGSDAIQGAVQSVAIQIPGLAGIARTVALHRFTMAYYMSAEAGMAADKCLRASLRATTNDAYARLADPAAKLVRRGDEVSEVLAPYGERLFPQDFMQALLLGEETGTTAELMHKQSAHYSEEAARKMALLARIAGGAVYALVGLFVIFMIYNVLAGPVSQPYRDAFDAVDDPAKWMRGGQ